MSLKTRATGLAMGLLILCVGGLLGGMLTHHEQPVRSNGQVIMSHNTCQAEDDPCWRADS